MDELVELYPSISVLMRDNLTGETKWVPLDLAWYDHSMFFWTEGNFSCDCNRGMLFYGDDFDCKCGHRRFVVFKAHFPDGSETDIDSPLSTQVIWSGATFEGGPVFQEAMFMVDKPNHPVVQ